MKADNFPITSFNYQKGNLQKKSEEIGVTFNFRPINTIWV